MARPKKYPDELVQRGIRLALESERPIAHIAADLGMHRQHPDGQEEGEAQAEAEAFALSPVERVNEGARSRASQPALPAIPRECRLAAAGQSARVLASPVSDTLTTTPSHHRFRRARPYRNRRKAIAQVLRRQAMTPDEPQAPTGPRPQLAVLLHPRRGSATCRLLPSIAGQQSSPCKAGAAVEDRTPPARRGSTSLLLLVLAAVPRAAWRLVRAAACPVVLPLPLD
jgi:hypothetical protein